MKAIRLLTLSWHIVRQMGPGYVLYRAWYELCRKSGLLRWKFPIVPSRKTWLSLAAWRNMKTGFFFESKEDLSVTRQMQSELPYRVAQMHKGYFRYFSSQWFQIPGWHTNPLTGHRYPRDVHWTGVGDFSASEGDIKYVWEKSRFTFLYDLVRYDYHFGQDQSAFALRLIEDWIDSNPVNCGPNWQCSQEIALRVLNWTFALHYYRAATALDQTLLDKILCSIYDQMRHVAANIRFSQLALKNNHILTEALGLFATGLLFPIFPESRQWLSAGKTLFEKEISEQIAADGTYVQFSMNYHRVVVQLLAWAIRLGELHHERLSGKVYEKARASLKFLSICQDTECGWLPNYGNNDGALFFPISASHFRDFRPQLTALASVLGMGISKDAIQSEEAEWLMGRHLTAIQGSKPLADGAFNFPIGGYHVIRDAGTLTFLRCGAYQTRPFQSDQLHLDVWIAGQNILRDAGTWFYNAGCESTRDFWGTAGHNTMMIGNHDQMQKHHRFLWTHWITKASGHTHQNGEAYRIEAAFEGYRHLGKGIVHRRQVVKKAGKLHWQIEDNISNLPDGMRIRQLWHPNETFREDFTIASWDKPGTEIPMASEKGWYSETYGQKVECEVFVFETFGSYVRTVIEARK